MKTIRFFGALAIMLGFTTGSIAQNTDTETLQASAHVLSQVQVLHESDLAFGFVAQGTTKTVALDGVVSGPTQQGNESVGRFRVNVSDGASIIYHLQTPAALVNGTNNLPITFVAERTLAQNWASGATIVTQNAPTSITAPGATFYVHLGGTVDAGGANPPPANLNYTGTVTLAITYN